MISPQLIFLTAVLNCAVPSNPAVVGFWETERTSKGGIGHTFEFKEDGSYLEAVSVIVDQKYHFESGKLSIFDPQEETIKNENTSDIALDLMTLTIKGPDGSTLRKDRADMPSSDKPSIVGVWRYRHYTGAIAYERYATNGLFQFRLQKGSRAHSQVGLAWQDFQLVPPHASSAMMKVLSHAAPTTAFSPRRLKGTLVSYVRSSKG